MKNWIKYLFLIILLAAWGTFLVNEDYFGGSLGEIVRLNKPCSKPIEYSIGEVDQKFGISKDEVLKNALEAEKVWETEAQRELFKYNPDAEFKINLIFDERQQSTNESIKLEESLEKLDVAHDSTLQEYDLLKENYGKRLEEYNKDVNEYEERIKKYNKEVAYWNSRGGATKEEYKKLEKEKKELKIMYENLEKERKAINALASQANQTAEKQNQIVNKYNSSLATYKNRFGESREFEKGVYNGQAINIYEFREVEDLRMTITHEFGHALGIDHLNDPSSIMYYLMGEQDLENPKLTEEDISALKNICKLK